MKSHFSHNNTILGFYENYKTVEFKTRLFSYEDDDNIGSEGSLRLMYYSNRHYLKHTGLGFSYPIENELGDGIYFDVKFRKNVKLKMIVPVYTKSVFDNCSHIIDTYQKHFGDQTIFRQTFHHLFIDEYDVFNVVTFSVLCGTRIYNHRMQIDKIRDIKPTILNSYKWFEQ